MHVSPSRERLPLSEGDAPAALFSVGSQNEADAGQGVGTVDAPASAVDLSVVEKLKQKYIKCKQQNDRLKDVLMQLQQQQQSHQEPLTSTKQHPGQLAVLQRQVEQLQKQLKVREIEQRQHMEELDALQYTNKKQQQQLLQLQQQQATAAPSSSATGGGGKWGIGLLAAAGAAGGSGKDETEQRLLEELQVLRDELERKIRENEQLHVQQFEEKQNQQLQQGQLASLQEDLERELETRRRLQQRQAEVEKQFQEGEMLLQREREDKKRLESRLTQANEQSAHQLASFSKQLADLQDRQKLLESYIRQRLPLDLRGVPLLSCYDFPSGGAAAVSAAERVAKQRVFSSIASLLVRLQQLLTAWGEALRGSTVSRGRSVGATVVAAGVGEGSRKSSEEKQGIPETPRTCTRLTATRGPGDILAAGLVAIGHEKRERLSHGAPREGVGGSILRGPGNAAVSGIHFKLTAANGKAFEALVEARKCIEEVSKFLLPYALDALPCSADTESLRGPCYAHKAFFFGDEVRGGDANVKGETGNQENRGAAADGRDFSVSRVDGRPDSEDGEGFDDQWGLETRRSLRQLGTAFRRFTTYSLVSLTLETDAFPIFDNCQSAHSQSLAVPGNLRDTAWTQDCPPSETKEGRKVGTQAGDARRSTAAFMEASRRFDKCFSLLLRVAELCLEARSFQLQGLSGSVHFTGICPKCVQSASNAVCSSFLDLVASSVRPGCSPRTGSQIRGHEGRHEDAETCEDVGYRQQHLGYGSHLAHDGSSLNHSATGDCLSIPLPLNSKTDTTPFCSVCRGVPFHSSLEPKHMARALSNLSGEHFRLLSVAVLPEKPCLPPSDGLCGAKAMQDCAKGLYRESSFQLGRSAGSGLDSSYQTRYSSVDFDRGKRESAKLAEVRAAVSAVAEGSAVAHAATVCAVSLNATHQMLQQVFLRHLDEAMVCMATMEGCVSARMCRPHIVEGHLLPLSGGSDAMVNLVQAMKLIDSYTQSLPAPRGEAAFSTSLNERNKSLSTQSCPQGKVESNVTMLRKGLQLLCSSPLALWIQLLRLPVFHSSVQRSRRFMQYHWKKLQAAPPRVLRDDALHLRHEVQRLSGERERLREHLELLQLDLDEAVEQRDKLMVDLEDFRDQYGVLQTRYELLRGDLSLCVGSSSNRLASATSFLRSLPSASLGTDAWGTLPDDVAAGHSSSAASTEAAEPGRNQSVVLAHQQAGAPERQSASADAGRSANLTTVGDPDLEVRQANCCDGTATAPLGALQSGAQTGQSFGDLSKLLDRSMSSKATAAAMAEAALLQRGRVVESSSRTESPSYTALATAAVAVRALNDVERELPVGEPGTAVHYQRELRRVYVQQVQQLLQHVQAGDDALASLRMQLSSCLKTIHSLNSQKQLLQHQLEEQQNAAEAAASKARLTEAKYTEQLSLLTEHYCLEGEKRKAVEDHMEEMRKQKVLCGRCGVWNPLGFLLGSASGGTCTMCRGRVMEPPV
ncbi:trichohyalin [Cystoisospora suis]|uniref:Trichohyalin n=1 Tax=Cystoisospora suis TaxID=483139 RepID=A0A2C6L2U7_9APIC|nr:trichohyalin [Cystoisospora suis]